MPISHDSDIYIQTTLVKNTSPNSKVSLQNLSGAGRKTQILPLFRLQLIRGSFAYTLEKERETENKIMYCNGSLSYRSVRVQRKAHFNDHPQPTNAAHRRAVSKRTTELYLQRGPLFSLGNVHNLCDRRLWGSYVFEILNIMVPPKAFPQETYVCSLLFHVAFDFHPNEQKNLY